jgi:hypothetical protein
VWHPVYKCPSYPILPSQLSLSIVMVTLCRVQAPVDAGDPFPDANADIIIRSSDYVDFKIRKRFLIEAFHAFDDMLVRHSFLHLRLYSFVSCGSADKLVRVQTKKSRMVFLSSLSRSHVTRSTAYSTCSIPLNGLISRRWKH